jgi:transglutaminase-like putative cysteine protease
MAYAQKVNTSPTPAWLVPYSPDLTKKPNAKNISDGYYLLLLEEQRQAELKSNYQHFIRQIVSEAGIQNGSEISVDYDPQYEKLSFHKIVIHRNGKEINRLPDAAFKLLQKEQDLSRFIYSGTYTAYLILEDVRKGDQIEYAYSITGDNPIFNGKLDNRLYFVAYEPIVNYYKNLIISPERHIRFKLYNNAAAPVQKTWNGLQVYEWNNVEVREADNSNYVPSWYNPFTRVQVSEYSSWKEVADWARKINTMPPSGPALTRKIAALKKAANGNKHTYLLQALRFVQDDIRYMGIEMGESSHRPNVPDRVLTQRFGDCKDKSLLLCTMLRANGIAASMAYVNTDSKGVVSEMLPSPNAFNHVIVHVALDNKVYWLDGTMSYQRGGLADFCEPDYQRALVVTDTTTQLTPIIPTTRGSIVVHEIFTLPDNENKDGRLEVITSYNRDEADAQRAELGGTSMKDKEKSYLSYYKKLYGDVTIKDSITTQDSGTTNTIRVSESYLIHRMWKRDSITSKLQFSANAQSFYDVLSYVTDEQRKIPVTLRYPYDLNYTIVLHTPIEWSLDQTPLHIQNDYYSFDYTAAKSGNQLTLSYHFKTFSDHVPVKFIPQYVKDLKKMNEITSLDLSWKPDNTLVHRPSIPGNWLAIILAAMFAGVFAYLASVYYKRSVLPLKEAPEPVPIGGGLALLAVGLVFSPMGEFMGVCKMSVFDYTFWINAGSRKDLGNVTLVQLFLIMEMVVNVFLLTYSVLLAVLFFNRRDTFPFALATYYFISTIFIYADNSINNYYFHTQQPDNIFSLNSILWPLLRMAIWVPYLLTSERGKTTFVMPYQAERNH